MNLTQPLSSLLAPLFEALPLDSAMPDLVPSAVPDPALVELVSTLCKDPLLLKNLPLQAGLWLYVDDLTRSHNISQSIESQAGSLWHGIMHRREGDFWNSKYWFRKAGTFSGFAGMNPSDFVDQVEKAHKQNPLALVAHQRQEWQVLFEWCAK